MGLGLWPRQWGFASFHLEEMVHLFEMGLGPLAQGYLLRRSRWGKARPCLPSPLEMEHLSSKMIDGPKAKGLWPIRLRRRCFAQWWGNNARRALLPNPWGVYPDWGLPVLGWGWGWAIGPSPIPRWDTSQLMGARWGEMQSNVTKERSDWGILLCIS